MQRIMYMFLEVDIRVKSFSQDGEIALMWAVQGGHNKMVKLLTENGSEINASSSVGNTPLMLVRLV